MPHFVPALVPGFAVLGLLVAVVGAALLALVGAAPAGVAGAIWGDAYLGRVVLFTLWQAFLSAALAVGLAVPVARALARRTNFPGRGLLLRLFGLPLVIPVIVAVLGIVAVYGQNGLVNRALAGADEQQLGHGGDRAFAVRSRDPDDGRLRRFDEQIEIARERGARCA